MSHSVYIPISTTIGPKSVSLWKSATRVPLSDATTVECYKIQRGVWMDVEGEEGEGLTAGSGSSAAGSSIY